MKSLVLVGDLGLVGAVEEGVHDSVSLDIVILPWS